MESKHAQMLRAIQLYYSQNLTQQEISKIMGVSRPTVSRLLEEGRKQGIVEIKINTPVSLDADYSETLRKTLHLKDVVVADVENIEYEILLSKVAEVAAIYFTSILKPNSIIGISWGRTVRAFVDNLKEIPVPKANIVQIVGGLGGGNPEIDGQEIAYKMSKKLSCPYHYIHAPAILNTIDTVQALKEQQSIKNSLTLAESSDIYISGIGSFKEKESSMQRAGYLNLEEKKSLAQQGAVGHLLAHMIDKNGKEITPYNDRILSIPLSNLKKAEWSIGIAVSAEKAETLLAAVNGGYFNILIIDKSCAKEVLRLLKD